MNRLLTPRLQLGFPSSGVGWRWSRSQGRCGMALVLGVLLSFLLGLAPARAQVGGLYWQCVAGDPTRLCPVSTVYPLPINASAAGASLTAVAGTQTGLAISSSTTLTVPTGATTALIQAQGTNNTAGVCLDWRDDGTAPTASTGQQMAAGASNLYKVANLPIALIAATGASCTATISYYK